MRIPNKLTILAALLVFLLQPSSAFSQAPDEEETPKPKKAQAKKGDIDLGDDEQESDAEDSEDDEEADPESPEIKMQVEVEEIKKIKGMYEPKLMDGIPIQAVETYSNPKEKEVGFGINFFPFDAFRTGFGANFAYTHWYDSEWAWEIANLTYVFTVDKGLTTELANKWSVNPEQLEKFRAIVATNMVYTFAYGKLLFLKKTIRHFRVGGIGGLNVVNTNQNNFIGFTLGLRFDAYVSESFSWKFEVRDHIPFDFSKITNFASFNIGANYSF
jgi:hypothetical protein